MFGLGMAPKESLSRLFNPFNLKILDLYLENYYYYYYYIAIFITLYISLLPLLLLYELILSPFLPLLFSIIIYWFGYFINSSVYFSVIISP